jgi:hypothetical protein
MTLLRTLITGAALALLAEMRAGRRRYTSVRAAMGIVKKPTSRAC